MKSLVVLGAGTAGTMVANRLHLLLDADEWRITLIDQNETHYYQPGFLFIPFGIYSRNDVVKPKRDFIPAGVELIMSAVEHIDADHQRVRIAKDKRILPYDFLVIATGCSIRPEQTTGLKDGAWGETIHEFYTVDGAVALAKHLRTWPGGRLLVNVVDNPIKCPVAPLEFLMLADAYFTEHGMRERVDITYATPLPGAFTKPIASRHLGDILERKSIKVVPDFLIERVEADARRIVAYDEQSLEYDLLISVPLNMGDDLVARSGLGDELNYVPVDKHTLQSTRYANIFALGDAAAIPTSKAGSVAHYMAYTLVKNLVREIDGHPPLPKFDGHATCFLASGFEKAILLDFNYAVEPLSGKFPFPGMGPFSLLQESLSNHWGKMMFRWVYWNLMMKGLDLPLEPQMNLAGKIRQAA
jgi:sulfide:quinone oxidoreductase